MKLILKTILIPFSFLVNVILKILKIFVIYRNGNAIGDQVCMSGVIKLINEQYDCKVIVLCSYPEVFYNNPRVLRCIDFKIFGKFSRLMVQVLKLLQGSQIENFLFQYEKKTLDSYMRNNKSDTHLIQAHSLHFKNKLNYDDLRCEIYFSPDEIEAYEKKFNLPTHFSLIQPLGKISYTSNKEWGFENYQQVVNDLEKTRWMQVGFAYDMRLKNVFDYCGKTNLRELFYLVSKANVVLANEGLLNHIASCFKKTKSIVIFSGFCDIGLVKYNNTISIYEENTLECKPCWKLDPCDIEGKPCMKDITSKTVVDMIKKEVF